MRDVRLAIVTLMVLAAALGGLFGIATPVSGQRPTSTPRSTPGPPTPEQRNASSCFGAVQSVVTTDTVRVCDPLTATVRDRSRLPVVSGGISVVFVLPEMAPGLGRFWMNATSRMMIQELADIRREYERDHPGQTFVTQVGIVNYGENLAVPFLQPTTNLEQARILVQVGPEGSLPGGAYVDAAQIATGMIRRARDSKETMGFRPCLEAVVYYVDFSLVADRKAESMELLRARSIILAQADYLYVGCVADDAFYGCGFVGYMQTDNRYYSDRFGNPSRFANQLRRDYLRVLSLKPKNLIRELHLTQRLPAHLSYVPNSGVPPPARVETVDGRTVLTWDWAPLDKIEPKEVTYSVVPLEEGLGAIEGSFDLEDTSRLRRTLALPSRPITVSGRCELPTAEPTATALPTDTATATPSPTATDTPEPTATMTATSTATPTPTATRTPVPVFLPILLREECRPELRPVDIVLALDASTSMAEPSGDGRTKIQAAQAAAGLLLDNLRLDTGDQAAIVAFSAEARLEQDLTGDRSALDRAIQGIQLSQRTCIVCAVTMADVELSSPRHRSGSGSVLVLLTDGRSNPRPIEEAVVAAAAAKAHGVLIFTIGLGADVDQAALQTMASQPSFYSFAPTGAELAAIYRSVVDLIPCPASSFWGGRSSLIPKPRAVLPSGQARQRQVCD